jgi:DNA-directed RNA polymerase specialized sigma24 family protein
MKEMHGNKFGQSQGTAMTRKEIAAMLGVSPETVIRDEQIAVKKLRAAIEAEAAEAGCSVRQWLFCGETI